MNRFKPDFAYTIDCYELGEVVYETFNAGSATIEIEGVTAHPMSAKNVLITLLVLLTILLTVLIVSKRLNILKVKKVISGLTILYW